MFSSFLQCRIWLNQRHINKHMCISQIISTEKHKLSHLSFSVTNINTTHNHLRQWALIVVPCEDVEEGHIEDLEGPRHRSLPFPLTISLLCGDGGRQHLIQWRFDPGSCVVQSTWTSLSQWHWLSHLFLILFLCISLVKFNYNNNFHALILLV